MEEKMHKVNRKIGYYILQIVDKRTDSIQSTNEFISMINFLNARTPSGRILNSNTQKKVFLLGSYSVNRNFHLLSFKSSKYFHRPPLLNKDTGSERDNPKTIAEGETELVHMAISISEVEMIAIIEERSRAMSISKIEEYLNFFLSKYYTEFKIVSNNCIRFSMIPRNDFIENLNSMSRVSLGVLYADKEILGSEFINISNRIASVKRDIEITVKSKKRESIKEAMADAFNMLAGEGSRLKRIRVQGKDIEGFNILLDTELMKKLDPLTLDANDETGLISTVDIFHEMMSRLEVLNG